MLMIEESFYRKKHLNLLFCCSALRRFPLLILVFKMILSASVVLYTTVILALSSVIVYRLFIHPLAQIPGPKLAALSTLWLAYHTRRGKNHRFHPALHKNYGPIVRIAPNQVLICSEEAVRTCYHAGSPFRKGKWYQVCAAPDSRRKGEERFDLLTEMNTERYRYQRRAIGPAYSIKGMEKHEQRLNTFLDKFVLRLKGLQGEWVDLAEWMHIFALDSLATVTFSKSLDYTGKGDDGGNMTASDKHWAYFTVVGLFPWLVDLTQSLPKIGMWLMIPIALFFGLSIPTGLPIFSFAVPNILGRLSKLESTAKAKMPADRPGLVTSVLEDEAVGKEGESEEADGEDEDLLASLMKLHSSKEQTFHPAWVLGIALTNFGAGHDTTTMTLSTCIYHVCSNKAAKDRLFEELRGAGIKKETGYAEIVNKAPYLMACMKEAMRLSPAIGFFLQRVVPHSGVNFSDMYLPPGTNVGVNPWAVHHDPSIFPDPETFNPDRWLPDGTEDKKKEIGRMDTYWLGFGGGSRSCPGQYLARFFVIKLLARLFGEFDVNVKGEAEFQGWFSTHLYGVDVRFVERS